MTRTRKLLLALAGAGALVVVAATALVMGFDPNRYKGPAIDYMAAHYQRRLVLDGPISLRVFPRLEVALERVSLSEPGQPAVPFVQLESARLAVQVLPLLRKQLVVDRVQASGLQLRYRRDEAGRRNFDDLLAPKPAAAPTGPGGPAEPMRLDISAIELQRLHLDVDDRQLGARGQVRLASFSSGRLGPGTTAPVKLSAAVDFTQPAARAQLDGTLTLQLDLGDAAHPLRLDAREVALHLQGAVPGVPRLDARLEGALAYDGGGGALQAEQLKLGLSADVGSLRLADSRVSVERLRYAPADRAITLRHLVVALQGQRQPAGEAAQPLSASLDWPALDVSGERLSGGPLSGTFALGGAAALQGRIESGAPTGTFERVSIPALRLVLGGASGPTRITGTVQSNLDVAPATKQLTLAALVLDTRVQNPHLRALAVQATGEAAASPKAAHWQLAGAINDQAFNTHGEVALGGARPRVQADARFGELDLDALLPPKAAAAPGTAAAAASATPPSRGGPVRDRPVDLAALRSIDGRLTLQAGTVRSAPYVLRNLRAVAALDDGRLDLAPLSFDTWDGTISARVRASAAGAQSVGVALQAQRIDIARALHDVAQSDLLEGRGQLTLDLQSSGRSVQALKAALAGDARLQLRDGAVRGFNLAQAMRQFQAALSLQQDGVSQARQTEKTDFSELSASFHFTQGVGTNRDLALKSPFVRVEGAGNVNLPASQLDYTLRAAATNTSKGQGGADLSALHGLTVPVRVQGPFDALHWRVQWSQVAVGAARNSVKQQLGDKLREELRGQLGGSPTSASDAASQPSDAELREKAREKLKERLKGLIR